ncbi:MAG: hypothetical protein ACJ8CR_20250 [Roseiflexaceae bacterium]
MLLAGCGPGAAEPTPGPAILPLQPRPAASRPGDLLPTVAAVGAALSGRLLFVRGGNLWLWQGANGSSLTSSGDAFQPAWSPDGARIAYIQRAESFSDLLVVPASGGEPVRLTDAGSGSPPHSYERIYESIWAFYPAWSPDGAEIAFASQAGPPYGSPAVEYRVSLFVAPSGGAGDQQQLYANAMGHVGRLAYAPDGATIVFAFAPVGDDAPRLYRYSRASGAAEPLPGAPEGSYDPAFSPDGRWLAFAARGEGRTDVFVMLAGGGTPIRLTSLGGARAPAFSPDGQLLAFLAITPGSSSFELWVAELETGVGGAPRARPPRQVTRNMQIDADSGLSWTR